ncbi:MAG: HAD family hydrolase [Candidatus Omnitrophota bacterium]
MKDIKLIVFDLDGTLVNAYEAIVKSFNYTMRKLHYPLMDAYIIRRAVGWGDKNLLKKFVKENDLIKALSIYRNHHKQALVKWSVLLPQAQQALIYLKRKGYKLAVASNRPARFSRILIRHLGIKKYFDYVLCADKLRNIKPHPQILREIMKKLHVGPKETVFVGDMAIDAITARRAKVRAIIVTTGSSSISEVKKEEPYRVIKKLSSLLKVF